MAYSGKSAVVYVTGTATTMTGEAMGSVVGKTYQITNTAKRCVSVADAVLIKDDGDIVPPGDYTFNFLYGIVTFAAGYTPTTPITIDGKYLPLLEITTADQWSLDFNADIANVTPFSPTTGYKQKQMIGADVGGTLRRMDYGADDYDTGGDSVTIFSLLTNSTPKVLQLTMGGSSTSFRAWAVINADDINSAATDVQRATFSWQASPQVPYVGANNPTQMGTWAWSSDYASY